MDDLINEKDDNVSPRSSDAFLDELMADDDDDEFDLTSLDVDVKNLSVGTVSHPVELVDGAFNDELPEFDDYGEDSPDMSSTYVDSNGSGYNDDVIDSDDGIDAYSYSDELPSVDEASDSFNKFDEKFDEVESSVESSVDYDFDDNEIPDDEVSLFDDVDSIISSYSSILSDDEDDEDDEIPEEDDRDNSDEDDSLENILSDAFDYADDDSTYGVKSRPVSRFAWDDEDDDSSDPYLNFDVDRVLSLAIERGASDVHISANDYVAFTVLGELQRVETFGVLPANVIQRIYIDITTNVAQSDFNADYELDTSYMVRSGRFKGSLLRLNVAKSFNNFSLVFRVISNEIPSPKALGITDKMLDWCNLRNGLVMVNGATGSGKSTTIASMIRHVQLTRAVKVVSIERPIEFMFGTDGKALVTQREVGRDTRTFASALTSAMRQAPDVILLGEVRDKVEVNELLRAAETGHLAISTMHTNSAAATVNRIRSLYEGDEQMRILGSLSEMARGFVNQALLKTPDGRSRFAVREILEVDDEISRMIQRGDVEGIKSYQYNRGITMEHELVRVVKDGLCDHKEARMQATNTGRFDALMKSSS